MKILQLIQKPQLRGAEIFACQLSTHLQDKGHEVVVITLFPGEANLPFNGRFIHLGRPLSKRFYDFAGWKLLAEIIRREQPDIIQANAGDTLKFAVFSKLLFGWKSSLVFRNANKIGDFINSKVKYHLNSFFFKKVDYVISVSKLCEIDFKRTFNFFPARNVSTVPIGINTPALPDAPPADISNLFGTGPVFVNAGSLVPEKNHRGLLSIFGQLLKKYPQAKLLIIGNGSLKAQLEQFARDLGIAEHVHFLGYRNDVLVIIRHADAFLLPSNIEGLPGVILEAFYCQTPVIASNVGGIGEVVRPNDTGWLIEKGDEASFVNAVIDSAENEEARSRYVRNAWDLVHNEYLNSGIAEGFLDVYKNIKTGKSVRSVPA